MKVLQDFLFINYHPNYSYKIKKKRIFELFLSLKNLNLLLLIFLIK
jgi:hypothetical protein